MLFLAVVVDFVFLPWSIMQVVQCPFSFLIFLSLLDSLDDIRGVMRGYFYWSSSAEYDSFNFPPSFIFDLDTDADQELGAYLLVGLNRLSWKNSLKLLKT